MKHLKVLGFIALLGMFSGNVMALPDAQLPNLNTTPYPILGESDLTGPAGTVHVDWIVSNTDLATGINSGSFMFATNLNTLADQGDYAAYTGSDYFYYFQIENTILNSGTGFSLDLDPDTVVTMGYMLGVDLDNGLDVLHDIAGEQEASMGITDFVSAVFDPNPPTPNGGLNFTLPPGLVQNYESTTFFVTCTHAARYADAELLIGPHGPTGYIPIPDNMVIVPEPMTLMLLGSSLGMFFLKRKRS